METNNNVNIQLILINIVQLIFLFQTHVKFSSY